MAILLEAYPITSQITYDPETDLPVYDRAVDSEVLRNLIMKYFTEGVFQSATDFLVSTADDGLNVSVSGGAGNVRGCTGYHKEVGTIAIDPPGGVARIDNIVLRWDANVDVRRLLVDVVKGPATGDAPTPTRTEDIWELVLARVNVRSTATQILVTDIEDTRLSADLCGIVQVRPNAEDPSPYFAQIQAYIDYLRSVIDGVIDGSQYMLKAGYDQDNTVADAGGIVPYLDSQLLNKATLYPATAEVRNGTLVISSSAPAVATGYAVNFIVPEGYEAGQAVEIDRQVVSLRDASDRICALEAAAGVPVVLTRIETRAFPRLGGTVTGVWETLWEGSVTNNGSVTIPGISGYQFFNIWLASSATTSSVYINAGATRSMSGGIILLAPALGGNPQTLTLNYLDAGISTEDVFKVSSCYRIGLTTPTTIATYYVRRIDGLRLC